MIKQAFLRPSFQLFFYELIIWYLKVEAIMVELYWEAINDCYLEVMADF